MILEEKIEFSNNYYHYNPEYILHYLLYLGEYQENFGWNKKVFSHKCPNFYESLTLNLPISLKPPNIFLTIIVYFKKYSLGNLCGPCNLLENPPPSSLIKYLAPENKRSSKNGVCRLTIGLKASPMHLVSFQSCTRGSKEHMNVLCTSTSSSAWWKMASKSLPERMGCEDSVDTRRGFMYWNIKRQPRDFNQILSFFMTLALVSIKYVYHFLNFVF